MGARRLCPGTFKNLKNNLTIPKDLNVKEFLFNQKHFILKSTDQDPFAKGLSSIIKNCSELKNFTNFFDFWPTTYEEFSGDVKDEAFSVIKDFNDKGKDNFSPLLFNDVNQRLSRLNPILENLVTIFGFSKMTYARNLAYYTPKGVGNDLHFDQNINIVYQIEGEKSWELAKNDFFTEALERYVPGEEIGPELLSYAKNIPHSDDLAKLKFTNILLRPGDILFLPKGIWHRTKAHSDSFSINFTFSAPCFLDLLLASFRAHLIQDERWRQTFIKSDAFTNHEQFQSLLKETLEQLINQDCSWPWKMSEGKF